MKITAEQIKACILGHAVGDALGVPVEFMTRKEIAQNPVTDMRGFGTYPVPAGSWSDDTSMTLCTLESMAKGRIDYDDIMRNFGKWYYENAFTPTGKTFDVGITCRYAIENYFESKLGIDDCGLTDEHSNGNGSLMRILPFSLWAGCHREEGNPFDAMIDAASALTHAHERSKLACKIYTMVLLDLLEDPSKHTAAFALNLANYKYRTHSEHRYLLRVLEEDLASLPIDQIRSSGYVVDTLEAALWCVLTTASYRECVLKAVNLGDDTDTVAAVAGGLAGVLYGFGGPQGIPQEWLDQLQKRDYIEELCDKAAQAWCVAQ